MKDKVPEPTLGEVARLLRSLLFRHAVAKYLEPDFVKRLDRLADTP